MKRISEILTPSRLLAVPLAMAALLSSCSMIHDDLPECATRPQTRATVNFIYDYNTADEDHFAESVGAVTLYVFDANDHLVRQIEHTAAEGQLKLPGFTVDLDLPAGTYKLYASARENTGGYEAAMQGNGAKFRRSPLSEGASAESIFYTLDHNNGIVEHQQQSLEHFWLTRTPQILTITEAPMPEEGAPQPADVLIETTVPLQRVTNQIHVEVVRGEDRTRAAQPILPTDYDIWIGTADGRHKLDLTATPASDAQPLTYTPYNVDSATTKDGEPCIATDFSTSRLFHKGNPARHDRLYIKSHKSGETFDFDLPDNLAKGREAYSSKGWSEQEYLDREYDYSFKVVFNEADDGWRYIEISIATLSWAKRIQNVEL